jgi:sterol desaturase/sphingolipid hydroxylase (fatty acid hydroxylase superfamily)
MAFYSFMIVCYWGSGLVFIVIEQMHWLDSIKIHHGVYNTYQDYWRCFSNLFLNYFMIITPTLIPGWFVLRLTGMSFSVEDFPSLPTFIWHMWLCWLGEDFFQYFFHRFLHIPWLYKNVHKLHHEFQTPFALAGSYATPYELVFLAICTFMPALLLRPHFFTFLAWILARQMDAVLEHSGYYLWNPLHVLPFYGGIVFHDYHHTGFTTNYASRFTLLDRLFGTYKEPPEQYGSGDWNDAEEVAHRRLEAEGVKTAPSSEKRNVKEEINGSSVKKRGRRPSANARS